MGYCGNDLIVFDFDHTIINCNSDTAIKTLVQKPIPEEVEALSRVDKGWTQYMQALFTFLHQEGVTRNDYEELLKSLPLVDGMQQYVQAASSGACPSRSRTIIISDANSFFIDTILEHHDIEVDKVFTNPAEFNEEGCLMVKGFHTQNFCSLCPPNLCKGDVIKTFRESYKAFDHTFYIADGSGDVCPALQLGKTDSVFARQGYSLLRKLENKHSKDLTARLVPWITVQDIIRNFYPK